jgi:hypothetical protein
MMKIKAEPPLTSNWLSGGIDSEEAQAAFRTWMRSDPTEEIECLVQEAWLEVLRRHKEERLH